MGNHSHLRKTNQQHHIEINEVYKAILTGNTCEILRKKKKLILKLCTVKSV